VGQVTFFLALAFSIVIAIFAVQNTQQVSVSFLFWGPATTAASVLVLISAALGALAMLLFGMAREVRMRWAHRNTSAQLKTAQKRVAELEAAQAVSPATATSEVVVPVTSSSTPTATEPTKS